MLCHQHYKYSYSHQNGLIIHFQLILLLDKHLDLLHYGFYFTHSKVVASCRGGWNIQQHSQRCRYMEYITRIEHKLLVR